MLGYTCKYFHSTERNDLFSACLERVVTKIRDGTGRDGTATKIREDWTGHGLVSKGEA